LLNQRIEFCLKKFNKTTPSAKYFHCIFQSVLERDLKKQSRPSKKLPKINGLGVKPAHEDVDVNSFPAFLFT